MLKVSTTSSTPLKLAFSRNRCALELSTQPLKGPQQGVSLAPSALEAPWLCEGAPLGENCNPMTASPRENSHCTGSHLRSAA